jgi:hypothetical protein
MLEHCTLGQWSSVKMGRIWNIPTKICVLSIRSVLGPVPLRTMNETELIAHLGHVHINTNTWYTKFKSRVSSPQTHMLQTSPGCYQPQRTLRWRTRWRWYFGILLEKNLLKGMVVNQAIRFFIFLFFRSVSAPEDVCIPPAPTSQLVVQSSVNA